MISPNTFWNTACSRGLRVPTIRVPTTPTMRRYRATRMTTSITSVNRKATDVSSRWWTVSTGHSRLQPRLAVPESCAGHPRVAQCARPGGVAHTGTSCGVTEGYMVRTLIDDHRAQARAFSPAAAPVVVYGTSWCAATQMIRRHLDRLGIPYRYVD